LTQADLTTVGRGGDAPAEPITDSIVRQIRGSNLLLAGRVLSLAVGLVTQVLMVRYLSRTDFGTLAYGLSIVAVGQTIATFGLDRAIGRFVPIYHERGDRARVLGTILMVAGTIVALGIGVIAGVFILHALLPGLLGGRDIGPLLLILVLLSPLQALDSVVIGLFAAFARPRSIFFRGYVLGPGLKLAAVGLAVLAGAGILFLAAGFVVGAAIGSGIYGVVAYRMLQSEGLLDRVKLREIRFPARAVFGLTIPLLTSDLIVVLIGASDVLLLGYFREAAAVASFAVVKPIAELNQITLLTFSLLFVPLAARLFARNAHVEMNELYWQTAAWVAVVSFPIFAVTFLLAKPLAVLLYGRQYEASGLILTILAVGAYLQASTGFNGTTLMVFGRIKYIVSLNGLAVVLNLALNLVLIPRYGAVGAAVGTTTTYALHNVLKQAALAHATSVQLFNRRYTRLYVTIGASAIALAAVRVLDPSLPLAIGAVILACLVTYGANRRLLRVADTFPELAALPFARFLFGRSS
jgi:O-antigen/teichoic acid export membrane protein